MLRLFSVLVALTVSGTALADIRATFRCEGGKAFTITFHGQRTATLVFAGTNRPITLDNQDAGSGISYVGGGWAFAEHHGDASLMEWRTGAATRSYSCRKV
jgi:membrane-bound inhibitor of C-type lysozyme